MAFSYVAIIIYILNVWESEKEYVPKRLVQPCNLKLSVVISARNEEEHIGLCIQSIIDNQEYESLDIEIIVVDDHSEDNTFDIAKSFANHNVKVIKLKDHLQQNTIIAYKKEAIKCAWSLAKGDYIIQLDADTVVPNKYLSTIKNYLLSTRVDFVAGPVVFKKVNSQLEHFQQLDIIGMMGVTMVGIKSKNWYMANGANMIYKKDLFDFDKLNFASGDDVFAIQNVACQNDKAVQFLKSKDIIVQTYPMKNLIDLYNQRLRWATKNKYMTEKKMLLVMSVIFLNALLFILHGIMLFINIKLALYVMIIHLFFKLSIDYLYLRKISEFFNTSTSLRFFFHSSLIQIFYIVGIGVVSLFVKKYSWKGRSVR